MPKTIIKNVVQQIGQLTGEVGEEIKKQPTELAGKILEQMGVGGSTSEVKSADTSEVSTTAKNQLEQMKAQEKARSQQVAAQISKQLEQEIEQLRKEREEQLRQRRSAFAEASADKETASQAPMAPPSKPGRRFGLGSRRIKSAQDQAQPETAGRRVGG